MVAFIRFRGVRTLQGSVLLIDYDLIPNVITFFFTKSRQLFIETDIVR